MEQVCCKHCTPVVSYHRTLTEFGAHLYRQHPDLESYICGFPNCLSNIVHKTSLMRHMKTEHPGFGTTTSDGSGQTVVSSPAFLQQDPLSEVGITFCSDLSEHGLGKEVPEKRPRLELDIPKGPIMSPAASMVLRLRNSGRLSATALQTFQKECSKMLNEACSSVISEVKAALAVEGVLSDNVMAVLDQAGKNQQDPFKGLHSTEDQLQYFSKHHQLVLPIKKYLDYRIDQRLNTQTNSYLPTQVPETFQYIPVIETLKLIISNKNVRDKIMSEEASNDGVFRSYLDGSRYKTHPILQKHPKALRLILYYDEIELANPVGVNTIVHKMGVFLVTIMNLPAMDISLLSSMFLLAIAYSEDLKKKAAFQKVLHQFLADLRQLESDEGVRFQLPNGEWFTLRATLSGFCGDSLAAHDILGLLSPSAKFFCRRCTINRDDFKRDLNAMGTLRTKELHAQHVEEVIKNPKYSSECGVRTACPIQHEHFVGTLESMFDIFHDIDEGDAMVSIKLVLRALKKKKYLTIEDFNSNIQCFSYGPPDSTNMPKANFNNSMIDSAGSKLKQSGSKMYCLLRVFPFLVGNKVPVGDQHMELIFLLQDISQILKSNVLRDSDIDRLQQLIYKKNELFFELFIKQGMTVTVTSSDIEDDPGDFEEPSFQEAASSSTRQAQNKKENISIPNKLHHETHYADDIRCFGPMKCFWCARFEARLAIFKAHASVAGNFKNSPKTLAEMFQLSHLGSFLDYANGEQDCVSLKKQGISEMVSQSSVFQIFINAGMDPSENITHAKVCEVSGEEFRTGLFVCTSVNEETKLCDFSLICDIIQSQLNQNVYFVLKKWNNLGLNARYNVYQVAPPNEEVEFIAMNVKHLAYHHAIAPWTPISGPKDTYLSLRSLVF